MKKIATKRIVENFPCPKWEVGVGDKVCDSSKCPHFHRESTGQCLYNQSSRPHSVHEISKVLGWPERSVSKILENGMRLIWEMTKRSDGGGMTCRKEL